MKRKPVFIEISRTDLHKVVKYLSDAQDIYKAMNGQKYVCRSWSIGQMIKKLQRNEKRRICQIPEK